MKVLEIVMVLLQLSIFVFSVIQTISCSFDQDLYRGADTFSCVQLLTDPQAVSASDVKIVKQSKKFINIAANETHLKATLPSSPACLIYSLKPSSQTHAWLSALERHMIIIEGLNCKNILASQFNVNMFCLEENIIYEKYAIRSNNVFRKLKTFKSVFPLSIYNKRLERRSDLQGVELTVTTLNYGRAIEGAVYGPPGKGNVTGFFGDLFMIRVSFFG